MRPNGRALSSAPPCVCYWGPAASRRGPQFRQRQIRQHVGAVLVVEDDFVGVSENVPHGVEINAPARDIWSFFVLVINRHKARGFTLGLGNHLLLVAFGLLDDACSLT